MRLIDDKKPERPQNKNLIHDSECSMNTKEKATHLQNGQESRGLTAIRCGQESISKDGQSKWL